MYQILKSVSHLQELHILTYSKEKLVIYSKEILQQIQSFRDYMSDIVAVATSNRGVFVVFCEREIIAYKPTLFGWERNYNKNSTNPIKDAFFSYQDNHIIGCSQQRLHIWKAEYRKNTLLEQLECHELVELNEIFTIDMNQEITNVKFSPDDRYFATLQGRAITVWDFEAISQFPQDGDLSQLPKVQLQHQDQVVSFKFRVGQRIAPSAYPTPNTIVTLTTANILTIFQEQSKHFCKLHTMHLDRVSSFCFIYLNEQRPYPWNAVYLEPDSIGIQDTEQPSVDYILIHEEQEMKIVKLDYLKNYSLQESVNVIHSTQSGELLKQVKKIIFADPSKNDKEKLEVVGFDRLWNIIKVVVDLKERTKQSYQCEKFTFQSINLFSYHNDQVAVLNGWNKLCLYPLREQNIINQEYAILEGVKQSWDLRDAEHLQQIFLFKDKLKENDILLAVSQKDEKCIILKSNTDKTIKVDLSKYRQPTTQWIRLLSEKEDLHLLLANKEAVLHLKIVIMQDINVEVSVQKSWPLTFPYQRLVILQNSLEFAAITGKSVTCFSDQMQEVVQLQKNFAIKQIGKLKGYPITYYVISQQNEIDFHTSSGEFLTRFSLAQFLVRVDKAIYDAAKVVVQVIPLNHYAFLLQIDNYITAFQIYFDKQEQLYKLNSLKHTYLNERQGVYCRRLSKNSSPSEYEFFETAENIVIKTGSKFKILNNSLTRCLAQRNWVPATINYKLMENLNDVQLYDAEFLSELISQGKIQVVQNIVRLILIKLRNDGSLGNRFSVPYKHLFDIYNIATNNEPAWLDSIKTYDAPKIEQTTQDSIDLKLNHFKTLSSILRSGQLGSGWQKLIIILDFLDYYEENRRSLDFYASLFMFYVHMYRNQPTARKNKVLTTREIVWAIHSLQKETLWQECIINSGDVSWAIIRRYSAVIWMDLSFIKQRVEEIALEIYKNTRDPFQSLLYFLVLGKKGTAITLFKKEQNQGKEYKNTFEFLEKDFTQDRWKSAASKNAYALVSKKRYQDAAAFFLAGGHIKDAVNVIAHYIEDIQLALLTAKLYEPHGGEATTQLINDYFIAAGEQMNDIWLLHIGYHMLGRYVDSVNALMRVPEHRALEYDYQGKAQCMQWPNSFTPQLSYYHPSALLLVDRLRDALHVRREIQSVIDASQKSKKQGNDDIFSQFYEESEEEEEEEVVQVEVKRVQEDVEPLKQQAIEYYYNTQQPQLGLIQSQELQRDSKYTALLVEQQTEMYVIQAIKDSEHFTNYVHLMQRLDDLATFAHFKKEQLYNLALTKIKQLKSPARLLTFAIHYEQTGFEEFRLFCQETQSLLFRVCLDYPMNQKSREFYLTFLQALYEIDVGLKQFQQSLYYQKKFDKKPKLNHIKMFALFITLIIALELHLWDSAFEQLRKLETFYNLVYKNEQECGYENLRDDFCEVVRAQLQSQMAYPNKSAKAHRSVDILAEAFPEDKYGGQIPDQQNNEIQMLLLAFALQSLVIKHFLMIAENNFKLEELNIYSFTISNLIRMAQAYSQNRWNVVDQLLQSISDFSYEQRLIEDLKLIVKESSLAKSQYFKQLDKFFPNTQQFFNVASKVQFETYLDELHISRTRYSFKYPASSFEELSITQYKNKLFKQGVEVYKLKTDNIRALCINNANPNEGYVLYNKFLRQINLHKTLLQKVRSQDGYNLVEEETIEEPIRPDYKHNNKQTIVKLCAQALGYPDQKETTFRQSISVYDEYKNLSENEFLERFQTCSNKNISEEDYQCLTAHPYLPLFLVGGKGSINLLPFKSYTGSVPEFTTQQKEYIDQAKFNNSGELFLGHDLGNNAYIWKLNRINKVNTPLLVLSAKNRPTTDLTFVNEGTVFASIYNSSGKPHYGMYDLLMPSNRNLIVSENFNGTDILFSTPMNSVLIANSKKGTVNFLDIRKNQIYKTLEIPFAEIKAIQLNKYQKTLVCACNDGSVKFISCDSLQTVHEYKPFRQEKKPPQIVSLCQTENATLAASSDGVISIVYLNA